MIKRESNVLGYKLRKFDVICFKLDIKNVWIWKIWPNKYKEYNVDM